MVAPPAEIRLHNRGGTKFWAHLSMRGKRGYLYRLNEFPLIVVEIKENDLRKYCRSGKSIELPMENTECH